MKIKLIAVGKRMPAWVEAGFQDYSNRLPKDYCLELTEINAGKRHKGADIDKLTRQEGEQMLTAIPKHSHIIALEVTGRPWSTKQLAEQLQQWRELGDPVSLLIGGPEGLAPSCLQKAHSQWSLSPLTLPHPLVRVLIAEQLYRAWTILTNHPYHR